MTSTSNYVHPLKAKSGSSFRNSLQQRMDGSSSGGEVRESNTQASSNQDDAPEVQLTQEEEDEVKQVKAMAQGDTNKVKRWRIMATFVLLVTAFCVTFTTYRLLKNEEKSNFETAFEQFSRTVGDAAIQQQEDTRNGLATMANTIATYAESNGNENWPFVTVPLFESMAQHGLKQAHMETINFLPRVEANQRYNWVQYANSNYQQWVQEGHLLQKGNLGRLVGGEDSYHSFLSARKQDGSFVNQTENDVYFASWQYSPPPATYDLINGDLLSVPQFAQATAALLELGSETLVTMVFPHVGIPTAMTREEHNELHTELLDPRAENPHSFFVHPIHRALRPGAPLDTNREIMGVLAGASAWDVALLDLLPDGVVGIHAVVSNNCGQSYTYEIRGGDALYLGPEDLHETQYDGMDVNVNLALHEHPDFATTPGHCQYQMDVYPSDAFRASYDSNTPEIFAAVVATTFCLVALVFFVYDVFVQRRNHNLIVKAAQTNAIVYSLFPKKGQLEDLEEGKAEATDSNTSSQAKQTQ